MREGQIFTALDRKNGTVAAHLDHAKFVAFQGDYLLYEVPGTDHGWANRPLKPGERAIRIVPLSSIAKIIVHG